MNLKMFDEKFIREMHIWAIPTLRVALGIVFLWFGLLKIINTSPVVDLIKNTYSFVSVESFVTVLGVWEVAIGLGLLFNVALRATLALLWLQMLGTLVAPALNPSIFWTDGNIFLLTMEGEFVVKNLVLIVAGFVIGGYEVGKEKRNA